jgi:prolyl-tRNA synthetase
MGATYLDEKGAEIPIIMGCYGIGINRIMAAAIEAGNDEDGIIWPLSLAPYQVSLIPLQVNKAEVMNLTRKLEQGLEAAGVDVLTDDRDQRPGVKFKDVDLIGVPLRVVIGERGLKEGSIEVKWRHEPTTRNLPLATAVEAILAELAGARSRHDAYCRERIAARSGAAIS